MDTILNMSIGQLLGGAAGILLILSTFIEIAPIKINPISSFLKWVGEKTNGEVMARVDKLDSKVENLESRIKDIKDYDDQHEAEACRIRILHFGDEIRRGVKHSQESFNQTLADMDFYDQFCADHQDFKNNKTIVTQARVREEYARCLEENDFL